MIAGTRPPAAARPSPGRTPVQHRPSTLAPWPASWLCTSPAPMAAEAEAAPPPQQRGTPALPRELLRLICLHASYPTLVSMQQAGGELGEEAQRRRDELEAPYWSYFSKASGRRYPLGEPFYRDLSPAARAQLHSAEARVVELVLDDEATAVDLPALELQLQLCMCRRCAEAGLLAAELTPGRPESGTARVISVLKYVGWHRPWESAPLPPGEVLRLVCQRATYASLVRMQQAGGKLGERARRRRVQLEEPYRMYFGKRSGRRYPLGRNFRRRLPPAAKEQLDRADVSIAQLVADEQATTVDLHGLHADVLEWARARCGQLGLGRIGWRLAGPLQDTLTITKPVAWQPPWSDPPSCCTSAGPTADAAPAPRQGRSLAPSSAR